VVVNIVGLDLDDLFVLINGQLENILRTLPVLDVPQRTQIDPPQQLVRFQVIGIALENVLGFEDGIRIRPVLA
jgi:hypothetical protein